ncbi:MAG TPA: hypothetical protein VMT96_01060 [Candidatus Bathyarchaeia archaeon]|nr:hypothetical protein [Candidatus Bathyarchaeia archaeon]
MSSRLAVGFPLYHQVPATFFSRWLGMNKNSVTSTVVVNGAYITLSMKAIVEQALALDTWDRLVIFEHDMLPPPEAFERIAQYKPEQAVVGSIYFGHEPPHTAICYIEKSGTYSAITPQTAQEWCAEPGLYRCDAVGFGFTSIARHVLEDWDKAIPMFEIDDRVGSHDIWFCEKARAQGFSVSVDSALLCEHLSQVAVGLSHNQDKSHMIDGAQIIDFNYEEA